MNRLRTFAPPGRRGGQNDSTKRIFEELLNETLPPPANSSPISVHVMAFGVDGGRWIYLGQVEVALYELGNESFGNALRFAMSGSNESYAGVKPTLKKVVYSNGVLIAVSATGGGFTNVYSLDSYSARVESIVLLAYDDEGRNDLAIIVPKQIVFTSTRRVAGYAEPGNLSIAVDHSNDAYDNIYAVEVGSSKIFDLDLNLPVSTDPGTTTMIELRGTETIENILNASYTINTTHLFKLEIGSGAPPPTPPQPPEEPEPNASNIACYVGLDPIPTSSEPITTDLVIRCEAKKGSIDPYLDDLTVEVTILNEDTYEYEELTLLLKKVSNSIAETRVTLYGDAHRFADVLVLWRGKEIMWDWKWNYVQS